MKGNEKIEKIITEKFNEIKGDIYRLESKVDELRTTSVPNLRERIATVETVGATAGKIWGGVLGGLGLIAAFGSLFVSCSKH